MEEFKDLKFSKKFEGCSFDDIMSTAKQALLEFSNGYSISVICGYGAYGNTENPYEIAFFLGDDMVYPDFTGGDVVGYLNSVQVSEYMLKAQNIKVEV